MFQCDRGFSMIEPGPSGATCVAGKNIVKSKSQDPNKPKVLFNMKCNEPLYSRCMVSAATSKVQVKYNV